MLEDASATRPIVLHPTAGPCLALPLEESPLRRHSNPHNRQRRPPAGGERSSPAECPAVDGCSRAGEVGGAASPPARPSSPPGPAPCRASLLTARRLGFFCARRRGWCASAASAAAACAAVSGSVAASVSASTCGGGAAGLHAIPVPRQQQGSARSRDPPIQGPPIQGAPVDLAASTIHF